MQLSRQTYPTLSNSMTRYKGVRLVRLILTSSDISKLSSQMNFYYRDARGKAAEMQRQFTMETIQCWPTEWNLESIRNSWHSGMWRRQTASIIYEILLCANAEVEIGLDYNATNNFNYCLIIRMKHLFLSVWRCCVTIRSVCNVELMATSTAKYIHGP